MSTNCPGNESAHLGPFQFSLRGLMVLAFGVAVGCSAMRVGKMSVGGGLLAAATTWIVLGLINEIRDLWITFHGRGDLTSDERWGWRFAVFWRMAIACLLLGYGVVNLLLAQGVLTLPPRPRNFFLVQLNLRDAVFCLALLVVLCSASDSPPERPRPSRFRVIGILAGAGAVVWCLGVWMNEIVVLCLVHVAIMGIEMSEPLWLTGEHLLDASARSSAFFWRSLFAAVCVLVSFGLIRQLAAQWTRGLRHRLFWASLLALSLANVVCFPIWVYLAGLPRLSPLMAEAVTVGPWDRWVAAGVMVIVLATVASFRMVQSASGPESAAPRSGSEAHWQRNSPSYYHRRRLVAALLVIAAVVLCFSPSLGRWVLLEPSAYLPAAVSLVALQRVFARRSRSIDLQPTDSLRLPLTRFCTVWFAMSVLLIFAIPTIAWFCFAFWLSPWYRWL